MTLGALSASSWGLGLGRLSVQSALGETLKAEIDITSLSSEEASTLRVRVAPPEVYRASGVEYNSVLPGTQVQTITRDGRSILRVTSDRAVQEPFVDVILELTWASGRLVREYTLLFDPPTLPKPVAAPPAVAVAPAPAPVEAPPVVAQARPAPQPAPAPTPAPRPRVEPPPPPPAPAVRAEAPPPAPRPPALAPAAVPATPASEYAVKPGDTLSRIAAKTQAPGVSLDQMLVGLYRNNQDAFIGNNMNRLKAGVVLQVPSSEELSGVSNAEARQVIQAQSADFSAYRQRLAGVAPTLQQEGSERQATGKVQAAVEDRKPAATTAPDKLTLSKAASAAAEVKASRDTEKKDSAARVAELTRNVEQLKKLSDAAAKPVPAPAPVATPAPAPAPVAIAAAPAPAPALAASEPASQAAAASAAVAVPAPVAKPAASRPALPPAPAPQPEPGLLDELLSNPLVAPLAGILILALGGLGYYRLRGRKASGKADTGFHESRLQPDSFFGATGGQRVDTRESGATGAQSSMSYSLSQLDAIGDVDPVAEADVYLAYGRDLQAEEILKEALRANPERLAIRLKLLEVYAKRRDTKGFEQLAIQLYAETHGVGEDWNRAQELGRQIDAENPLYQPGGAPAHPVSGPDIHPEPMDASTLPQTVAAPGAHLATEPLTRSGLDTSPSSDFGSLDLDLDLDAPTTPPTSPIAMEATQAMTTTVEQAPMSMDFDLSTPPPPAPAPVSTGGGSTDLDLEFDLGDLGEPAGVDVPKTTPIAAPAPVGMDFDLGSIDLDLPDLSGNAKTMPVPAPSSSFEDALNAVTERPPESLDLPDLSAPGEDGDDPLVRQLELADEFRQIGDTEGAREVLQELIGKASGDIKARAVAMLDSLR